MAMAIRAAILNLLRSAMSACNQETDEKRHSLTLKFDTWIVGKVEAPAKANMMEPNAGEKEKCLSSTSYL